MPRIERDIAQLKAEVAQRPLPRHVGIIMDGNGRWAEQRSLPRLEGHRRGSDSVREVTRAARKLGLPALTLYAFSAQNWQRPPDEVSGLMDLLRDYLHRERPEIMDNGIRLHAIGELDRLPARVRDPLEELRRDSAGNSDMVLTLALSYGGREEIVAMARRDRPGPAAAGALASLAGRPPFRVARLGGHGGGGLGAERAARAAARGSGATSRRAGPCARRRDRVHRRGVPPAAHRGSRGPRVHRARHPHRTGHGRADRRAALRARAPASSPAGRPRRAGCRVPRPAAWRGGADAAAARRVRLAGPHADRHLAERHGRI